MLILRPLREQTTAQWAGIGVLLGLLFWTRNDMIFIVAAVACQRLVHAFAAASGSRRTLVFHAAIAVSVSGLVALPWVAFNYFEFGHLMPISGIVEAGMRSGSVLECRSGRAGDGNHNVCRGSGRSYCP